MENNICQIYAKYIKYLSLLIIFLLNTIPSISFCNNEKNTITSPPTSYKQLKDPTMPKTYNSLESVNKTRNNSDSLDEDELLKLSLIVIKDLIKTVTINNQNLKEQDQIEGYKIIKIEENKVLLQDLTMRDEKFYKKFKNFFSKNKVLENKKQEKFIELYLPKINIKQSITEQLD